MFRKAVSCAMVIALCVLTGCGAGASASGNSVSGNNYVFEDFEDTLYFLSQIKLGAFETCDAFEEYANNFGKVTRRDNVPLGALDGSGQEIWSDTTMVNVDFDLGDDKSIPITYIKFNGFDNSGENDVVVDFVNSAKNIPVYPMDDAIKNTDSTYRLASPTEKVDYFLISNGYVEHIYDKESQSPYDYYDVYLGGKDYCIIVLGMYVDKGKAMIIRDFLNKGVEIKE